MFRPSAAVAPVLALELALTRWVLDQRELGRDPVAAGVVVWVQVVVAHDASARAAMSAVPADVVD